MNGLFARCGVTWLVLASFPAGLTTCWVPAAEPAAVETSDVAAPGLRHLASQHLQLLTDLPPSTQVDALPALFDQAFSQWCQYIAVDATAHRDWRVQATLLKSSDGFRGSSDVPEFAAGYSRGDRLWLIDQPSDYYRLHLLLHEGTHVFMDTVAGGKGPPWLAEGMAELLATHRMDDGRLMLNVIPRHRDGVPKWGRIEMIQAANTAGRTMSLEQIFAYDARASLENLSYAWCWAAAVFFDHTPEYQSRFRELARTAGLPNFADRIQKAFAKDWPEIHERWQLFCAGLDYGYDFDRNKVEFRAGSDLEANGAKVEVSADRSWQSSGVHVEAGQKYRLRARGRYQVAREPKVWWCEPGGVTIRYYRGQPLGILLAAVRADGEGESHEDVTGLVQPIVVGLGTTLVAPRSGTLYFRINDSAGELEDNSGSLGVEIRRG